MRKSAVLFGTSLTFLISALAASSASAAVSVSQLGSAPAAGTATTFVTAPYTAGAQSLFSATIVNASNVSNSSLPALSGNNAGPSPQGGVGSKQGGLGFALAGVSIEKTSSFSSTASNIAGTASSSVGFSSANSTSGISSAGFSSANNTSGASSVGFSSSNITSGTSAAGSSRTAFGASGSPSVSSGSRPILVLTSLVNSPNPRAGSAGAVFQGIGNTQVSTVTFQYGTLAAATGVDGAVSSIAPVLVIDDQPSGSAVNTRFLPVSSGTVTSSSGSGLTTVSFNANQLQIAGQVQRIGIALYQRGTVAVDNITVNGVRSSGLLAQGQQSFPF